MHVPEAFTAPAPAKAREVTLLHVPCPICSGVGDMSTDDGHRQNDKDTCTSCGGLGQVLARTGETPAAAFDPAASLPLQQGRV